MNKDLRVVKTEKNIKAQFIRLLSEKSFREITIEEILDLCEINRSTFYRHYKDKYDLADQIAEDQLALFQTSVNPAFLSVSSFSKKEIREYILPLLKYFEENREVLKALENGNLPINVFERMFEYMHDALYQYACTCFHLHRNLKIVDYYLRLIATNILTTMKWWHNEAEDLNAEQILSVIADSISEGVFTSMQKNLQKR